MHTTGSSVLERQRPAPPGTTDGAAGHQPVASHISNLARLVIAAVVLAAVVLIGLLKARRNTRDDFGPSSSSGSWPGLHSVVILASGRWGIVIGGLFVGCAW